ncbi:hypothetical protein M8C21_022100 [Ambrosia artemisiifolia]|uniref:BHLH domain-containing protein n=1 Tax=Ambrosia artemisiifolia TaxID=4212 RepID=A0AAD5GBH0_AMBAR|nr:hypothetical protein M8C21_022100 [Ambrosia artemisiifolia]
MEGPSNFMQHQPRAYCSDLVDSFSCQSFKGCPNVITTSQSIHVPTINSDVDKQQDHKTSNISPFAPSHASPSNTFTISFGNSTSPQETNNIYRSSKLNYPDAVMPDEETRLNEFLRSIDDTTRFRRTRRNERQVQEHVLSERKRREKLAERFTSLSALLPGLKRMDKATVLEGARKYIMQLQTLVKELEETSVKGKDNVQELGVSTGISMFCGDHEDVASSSDETNYLPSSSTNNPEIKARISGSKMLVRIYCMDSSSIVSKTITEFERLGITVDCCSVLPFGTTHLVTIVAQMSDEMVITAKYLVRCLLSTLRDFH